MTDLYRTLCVDANLWIRYLAQEEASETTGNNVRRWIEEEASFIAPSFMLFEVASTIRKKQKLGLLGSITSRKVLAPLFDLPIVLYQSERFLRKSMKMAEQLGETSIYDAGYLALAMWQKVPFFTADKRFYDKAKPLYAGTHFV